MANSKPSGHETLVSLLQQHSLRVGEFTLSSGKTSHYYIDARLTTMSAQGLEVIGSIGVDIVASAGWPAQAVGGLTLGADPVAYALALASRKKPPVMDAFTVRKQPKSHGTARRIEGCFSDGLTVIVVEDVITTGGSALSAIEAVEAAGGHVSGVLAVVDRLEGGRQKLEARGYHVETMVTVRDLGVDPNGPQTP